MALIRCSVNWIIRTKQFNPFPTSSKMFSDWSKISTIDSFQNSRILLSCHIYYLTLLKHFQNKCSYILEYLWHCTGRRWCIQTSHCSNASGPPGPRCRGQRAQAGMTASTLWRPSSTLTVWWFGAVTGLIIFTTIRCKKMDLKKYLNITKKNLT